MMITDLNAKVEDERVEDPVEAQWHRDNKYVGVNKLNSLNILIILGIKAILDDIEEPGDKGNKILLYSHSNDSDCDSDHISVIWNKT
ncbi:hypothetical protein PoB_003986100 [Plakobranchus ocellatus]|uniref:Uncharacterized protein n=1 Tax=Plakobranchus ocellatus TaxID=259542 RepID=A0AAV4AYL9_9GAST|nr:hypothetical protein PoB_003986100 [Plakobranchus ocellatus]